MVRRVTRKATPKKTEVTENKPRMAYVATDDEEHDDEQYVQARNRYAREHGIDNSKPAERISRVVHIQFSAGDDMRDVNLYDFTKMIFDAVGTTQYGKPGIHGARMNGYYLVDGKLCPEVSMDWEKENFKDGHTPPEWAGGPKPYTPAIKSNVPQHKTKLLSAEEIKTQYPAKRTVRQYNWDEEHIRTGVNPNLVTDEKAHEDHVKKKLKVIRAATKKSALPEPQKKRIVVKKKPPETVKKKVVVRRAK